MIKDDKLLCNLDCEVDLELNSVNTPIDHTNKSREEVSISTPTEESLSDTLSEEPLTDSCSDHTESSIPIPSFPTLSPITFESETLSIDKERMPKLHTQAGSNQKVNFQVCLPTTHLLSHRSRMKQLSEKANRYKRILSSISRPKYHGKKDVDSLL